MSVTACLLITMELDGRAVAATLAAAGLAVEEVPDLSIARRALRRRSPSVIVLLADGRRPERAVDALQTLWGDEHAGAPIIVVRLGGRADGDGPLLASAWDELVDGDAGESMLPLALASVACAYDAKLLEEVTCGDAELRRELFELFATSAPSQLTALCVARDAGNCDALRFAAHRLRGSCANVGGQPAAATAAAIERLARAGQWQGVNQLLAQLQRRLTRLLAALASEWVAPPAFAAHPRQERR